ncbi:protein C2-DOMAIN ABA-RELATED 4-like [Impatiens glandulifera]|uniref:protein C2-DOMAIN ABA-RELATED 4-like n=1 Tax=Impatiens glandulifera TaxID=253017 RepID=UPI001FB10FA9|nr:protein C2-DOMAIN ABA-RELATED 4-like [Impatiens glandulifera]
MDELMGLLRVQVKRCYNLPVGDTKSSDPYVVIQMGQQKLRTNVVRKDVNPKWEDEDLTFSISEPNLPIKLTVYDYDTFNKDDKMGDAVFDIQYFVEAMKMDLRGIPAGTVIARIKPSRENSLAGESCIRLTSDGNVVQDMILRLRNAEECGEVEISLSWIDVPATMVI